MQNVEIRTKGILDQSWQEWLEGFSITYPQQNETVLLGAVKDQAELYGLIAKLRDLGVTLLTVNITAQDEPAGDTNSPPNHG